MARAGLSKMLPGAVGFVALGGVVIVAAYWLYDAFGSAIASTTSAVTGAIQNGLSAVQDEIGDTPSNAAAVVTGSAGDAYDAVTGTNADGRSDWWSEAEESSGASIFETAWDWWTQ